MSEINWKAEQFKKKAYGHADIWECSLDEFIDKVIPVWQEHQKKNKLSRKVMELSAQFLRIKFDNKELKGTIEYEVAKAIEESMMYYVNIIGEDI